MAFVAEDGTGLINANSLCSVSFANAYFADRGNAAWKGTDPVKQAALIRATDYVEMRWSARFKGEVQFPDTPQALSFPREDIGYDGQVPEGVQKAIAEYALRALSGPLTTDPTVDVSGLQVQSSRKKVGPIETETSYKEGGTVALFRAYPAADGLIAPFLKRVGGLVRN